MPSSRLRAPSLVVRRRAGGMELPKRGDVAAGTLPVLRCAPSAKAAVELTVVGRAAAAAAAGGRKSAQPSTCRICQRSAGLRLCNASALNPSDFAKHKESLESSSVHMSRAQDRWWVLAVYHDCYIMRGTGLKDFNQEQEEVSEGQPSNFSNIHANRWKVDLKEHLSRPEMSW